MLVRFHENGSLRHDVPNGDKARLLVLGKSTEVHKHILGDIDYDTASVRKGGRGLHSVRNDLAAGDVEADLILKRFQTDQFCIRQHGIGVVGNGVETPNAVKIEPDIGGLQAHFRVGTFDDTGSCAAVVDTEGAGVQIIVVGEAAERHGVSGDAAAVVVCGDGADIIAGFNAEIVSAGGTGNAAGRMDAFDIADVIAVGGPAHEHTGDTAGAAVGSGDITDVVAALNLSAQITHDTADLIQSGDGSFIHAVVNGNCGKDIAATVVSHCCDTAGIATGGDSTLVGTVADFQICEE